jgi:hypothetical protein
MCLDLGLLLFLTCNKVLKLYYTKYDGVMLARVAVLGVCTGLVTANAVAVWGF